MSQQEYDWLEFFGRELVCPEWQDEVVEFISSLLAVDNDQAIVVLQLVTEITTVAVVDVGHVRPVSLVEDKVTPGRLKTTIGGNWQWPLLITAARDIINNFLRVSERDTIQEQYTRTCKW
jgi:hypothetical protein